MSKVICRVCFQKTDWHETQLIKITNLREIVKTTQLTSLECPSLSSYKGHQICNTCITNFRSLTILHNTVSKSNNKVEGLMAQNCNNGNSVINLTELFPNLENVQICRLCLKPVAVVATYLYETSYNVVPYNFIVKMLEDCNLELVYLRNTSKPVLCHICWQRIQVVYAFWKHCNTVSGKVDYYCRLLVKLKLDQNDLDDIVHMWDNLIPKSDLEYDETSSDSTSLMIYLEDDNYSKNCIGNNNSDAISDTLSATSLLDPEICRTLNNIIKPPSPSQIVNTSSSDKPDYHFLSKTPEPISRLDSSDNEDDLSLLDIIAGDRKNDQTNKICIMSNIVLNSPSPETASVLPKRRGRSAERINEVPVYSEKKQTNADESSFKKRLLVTIEKMVKNPCSGPSNNSMNNTTDLNSPPLLKNQKEVGLKLSCKRRGRRSNKKSASKTFLDKIRASFQCNVDQLNETETESLIKKTPVSEDDDFVETDSLPVIENSSITPNICIESETHYSEDSEGPPDLECVADDSLVAVNKRKDSPVKCGDKAGETLKKTPELETSKSTENKEVVKFHIEPFLSDNEEPLPPSGSSKSPYSNFKELYVLLEKYDLSPPQEHAKSPTKETEKPVDVLKVAKTTQKTENQCDLCNYRAARPSYLKKHKLLRHWTNELDCSQCNHKRKIGTKIVCLICNRQFHPACMGLHQLFDTNRPCTHLAASHCIVLTKNCLIASNKVDPLDVNEPTSCECCDKPLTNYLGCEICGRYSHYKCAYDKGIGGYPICTHLPSLFRKIASILPNEDVKCGQCKKMVINTAIPCPKCLTFMHPDCLVENFTPNCDHRDVLCK